MVGQEHRTSIGTIFPLVSVSFIDMKEKRNKSHNTGSEASGEKPARRRSAFNEQKSLPAHPKRDPEKDDLRIENHDAPPGLPDEGAKKPTRNIL